MINTGHSAPFSFIDLMEKKIRGPASWFTTIFFKPFYILKAISMAVPVCFPVSFMHILLAPSPLYLPNPPCLQWWYLARELTHLSGYIITENPSVSPEFSTSSQISASRPQKRRAGNWEQLASAGARIMLSSLPMFVSYSLSPINTSIYVHFSNPFPD
jgi:hypothetical protein